jgi:hypothetical protein
MYPAVTKIPQEIIDGRWPVKGLAIIYIPTIEKKN